MRKLFLSCLVAVPLAGCAQGARVEQMSAAPTTALPANSALQHTVRITGVSRGNRRQSAVEVEGRKRGISVRFAIILGRGGVIGQR